MKSISELVIGKQWDIVNQGSLHQSFNKMLSKRGGRSAGGERRNRVIPASLIAILEADNPLQCELKRIILNEPVLFMPGKTFSKLLHCITGYCILCDNEQFFSFRQVRARLLINRKKGDVLLT